MTINSLIDLYHHMEWADANVWTVIFESEKGQSDEEIYKTFHHIHTIQHAFLNMWNNNMDIMSPPEFGG